MDEFFEFDAKVFVIPTFIWFFLVNILINVTNCASVASMICTLLNFNLTNATEFRVVINLVSELLIVD